MEFTVELKNEDAKVAHFAERYFFYEIPLIVNLANNTSLGNGLCYR